MQFASSDATWSAPQLAVIVPTFNEADNVAPLYAALSQALVGIAWEMIVVDDNSPDGTADLVKTLSLSHRNVRALKRLGRRGLSSACVEGIEATAAPFVAVIDADLQHDEKILPQMLAEAVDGAELVIGSRFSGTGSAQGGFSGLRFRASQLATTLAGLVTGKKVSDPLSGFFLLRREVFERLAPNLATDGFKILLDIIVTASRRGGSLRVAEVPYTFRPRRAGQSKMSPLIAIQFLGLWLSKLSGGILPTSFLLFAMVGFSGLVVHLSVLGIAYNGLRLDFTLAQIVATLLAMSYNFFLNNILTYADRRLRGWAMWRGLLVFYLVCSIGGVANVSFSTWIYQIDHAPFIAGFAGAMMSSVFNYAVTRMFTWK